MERALPKRCWSHDTYLLKISNNALDSCSRSHILIQDLRLRFNAMVSSVFSVVVLPTLFTCTITY